MTKSIITGITINAPCKKVWSILTDFSKYSEWNPFIKEIQGTAEEGETISIALSFRNAKFKPIITGILKEHTLVWKGKFFIKGIFDGEHRFNLEEGGDKTTFVQEEIFSGFLVSLLPNTFFDEVQKGFEEMNLALKKRAESSKKI